MGSKRRGARMVCERPAAAEAGIQTAASPASTAAQATTGTAASGVAQLSAWRLSAWRLSALVRGGPSATCSWQQHAFSNVLQQRQLSVSPEFLVLPCTFARAAYDRERRL